jgi:hypothetical protein
MLGMAGQKLYLLYYFECLLLSGTIGSGVNEMCYSM